MEQFLGYLITGLSIGSLYSLVGLGIVLIYRSTSVLNFAHGDMATVGAFIGFSLLCAHVPFWLSFLLPLILGGGVGMLFYFCILIPAQRREASLVGQVILTLGFSLVLQGVIIYIWGAAQHPFPFPLSDSKAWNIGGVVISELTLGTLGIGLIGALSLYLLVQKTRLGLAMRATSENLPAAQTLAIPTRMVLSISWGLAISLGVLAGVFLAPTLLLDPSFMLEPFLKGVTASVMGGLKSLPGAIVGGILLGVVESLAGGYISIAFKNTLAFLIIIGVLLIRPEGLLGKEFKERV
jgi:branched-chain amino acid transport system permease protein